MQEIEGRIPFRICLQHYYKEMYNYEVCEVVRNVHERVCEKYDNNVAVMFSI